MAKVAWHGPLAGEVVGPPAVLDARAVRLTIRSGLQEWKYVRKLDHEPANETLMQAKGFAGTIAFTPVRAGEYAIFADYAQHGEDPIAAREPAKVVVKPAPGGQTELGCLMKTT